MSLATSPRRDQRRRLLVNWKRSSTPAAPGPAAASRSPAEYAPEADPRRLPGPATLLPTGLGGLTLAALAILTPMAAAIVAGGVEPILGRDVIVAGGRFARTIHLAEACFDPRGAASVQAWLAQVALLLAAGVALVVRLMRRHRRDDYRGRYRAWGWLAGLFTITAAAGVVPLGPLVSAAVVDATGIQFGPQGLGWWLVIAATCYAAVALWAVLPLHERFGTAAWLATALIAWAAAIGCSWVGADKDVLVIASRALWSAGAALAAVAMLAAARSVIREVRGLPAAKQAAAKTSPSKAVARPSTSARAEEVEESVDSDVDEETPDFTAESGDEETSFLDGSEPEHRHLSKAERKRLKKLARMRGAA